MVNVHYECAERKATREGKALLQHLGKLFVWGNKETKKFSWDRMESGDLVLFYKGREGEEAEGKFVYAGRLYYILAQCSLVPVTRRGM